MCGANDGLLMLSGARDRPARIAIAPLGALMITLLMPVARASSSGMAAPVARARWPASRVQASRHPGSRACGLCEIQHVSVSSGCMFLKLEPKSHARESARWPSRSEP